MVRDDRRHDAHATTPDRHTRRREPDQQQGPVPSQIADALSDILDTPPKRTPPVGAVRTLQAAGIEFPLSVGDRVIKRVSIAHGKPRHGAMRSDDHVSGYEVDFPGHCDECGSYRLRYEYSAHHNIAGSRREWCPRCDDTKEEEQWS